MIPTGFAIIMGGLISLLAFTIGRAVEFYRSQEEIDILTKIIEGRCKEVKEDD